VEESDFHLPLSTFSFALGFKVSSNNRGNGDWWGFSFGGCNEITDSRYINV